MVIKQQTIEQWIDLLLLNDCEPDECLDRIVQNAAQLFKVQIAMINLLTSDKITFKACVGRAHADSVDRNGSFCDLAVKQESPLMIVDASKDDRFKTYGMVTGELQIRSYLGQSLHAPDGTKIATLCLLDSAVRSYTLDEQVAFSELARAAESELSRIFAAQQGPAAFILSPILA